jgi:ornithine cyclodeaminase/alanine dehydrogenase-like protein (mu-crystallin family)
MLFLDREAVESLLDTEALVDALAPAMVELSEGSVSVPQRTGAEVRERDAALLVMPGYIPSTGTLVTKLVSVFPGNEGTRLPSHHALLVVFDSDTGVPAAVMDAAYLTEARTAAGSALATRLLARPDASTMAVLGTGVQARSHALAVSRVRPVSEVRIAGRDERKARRLAEELSREIGPRVSAVATYADAVDGAGIVCTTTHAVDPVLRWEWLTPGVHVNAVGLNQAGRELDADTVVNSLVVVESRQAALAPPPSGANDLTWPIRDGVITEDHVHAEIGDLVSGSRVGRTSSSEVTVYKSVGVAVQDAVAAQMVLSAARERGVGVEVAI